MSEKEGNHFGKKKPTGKLVGSFYVTREENTSKVKVEHKSGDFNFRLWCGETMEEFYRRFTNKEFSESFGVIFAGIKTFTIASLQNPQFFVDYLKWLDAWAKENAKQLTPEEDEAELKKVKDDKLSMGDDAEPDNSGEGGDSKSGTDSVEGNEAE